MLVQALIAAAGTVTPTPRPDPEAGSTFSLANITRDAETNWPRVFPPTVASYSGTYHQLGHLVYDWETNTRFWLHHTNNNTIRQYDLPYAGFVSNVLTTTNQLSLSSVDAQVNAFTFGAAGTKLYVVGRYYLYEFNLSTAYNVATANLVQSLDMRPITVLSDTNPNMFSLQFNYTGRRMYLGCRFYNEVSTWMYGVLQFTLSSAWDISTAIWDGTRSSSRLQLKGVGQITSPTQVRSVNISQGADKIFAVVGSQSSSSSGVGRWWFYQIDLVESNQFGYVNNAYKLDFNFATSYVNLDQTRAYFIGNGYIRQYNFGTPGQANTLGYGGAYNVGIGSSVNERYPECIAFSYDGTRAYVGASDQNKIFCLTLSYPWEISTAEWRGAAAIAYKNLGNFDSGISGIYWSPDGYQLYILGFNRRAIKQLSVNTPFTFDGIRETASRTVPYANSLHFSSDGTIMLVVGTTSGYIYKYSGPAFSPISMSYVGSLNYGGAYCAAFNGSGSHLWIAYNGSIYEYKLRSDFDIIKPKYTGYRYLMGTTARCMQFSPDGYSLFISVWNSTGGMRQLFLSNPWDLRSVYSRYDINLKPISQDWQAIPGGTIFSFNISQGGDVLTVVDSRTNVFNFELGQPWTLSSVSAASGIADFLNTPTDNYITTLYNIKSLAFSSDGLRLYAAQSYTTEGGRFGTDGAKIIQYNLNAPWDINYAGAGTALYLSSNFGTQSGFCMDIAPDGTYILVGYENQITRIPLSTPYELGTAQTVPRTGIAGSWGFSSSENTTDVYMRPDGGKIFVSSPTRNNITEYNLTTPYQIHTATLPASNYVKGFSSILNCKFNAGGTAAYMMHATNLVSRVELGSTWNIATATIVNPFYGAPTRGRGWDSYYNTNSYNVFKIGANGLRMITVYTDGSYQRINNLALNGEYNITQPTSVATWVPIEPTIKNIRFRYDGLAIYMVSWSNRYGPARVIEYETNTPWTANHSPSRGYITRQVRYLSTAPETLPRSMAMREDGGQIWILGASRRTIRSYQLLQPFNISSAIFDYEMGIAADRGGTYPVDLIFSPMGKKFLIAETAATSVTTGGAIHEYRCTRPFDISSAEWVRTYPYGNISHNTRLGAIDVSHDGRRLFAMGGNFMFSFRLTDD